MSAAAWFLLLAVLALRCLPLRRKFGAWGADVFAFAAFALCSLPFSGSPLSGAVLALLLAGIESVLVRRRGRSDLSRQFATLAAFLLLSYWSGSLGFGSSAVPAAAAAADCIRSAFSWGSALDAGNARRACLVSCAFIGAVVEANYLILPLLRRYVPSAAQGAAEPDRRAGLGRLIGMLERAVLFVLIVSGNSSVIGFVIAAKAVARFKELEDKDFAEYFLVGTLASVLPTLAIGLLVRQALG